MSERGSSGNFGLRLRGDSFVHCHRYECSKPILSVSASGVSLSLSQADIDEPVTDDDLWVAERLVGAAQTYLSELQRLHAAQAVERPDVA